MSKNGTPYPTSHAIEDLFNNQPAFREAIIDSVDDNVDVTITGYDHHFSGDHKGKDALQKNLGGEFGSLVDADKVKYEIIRVIGGGESPWAAIEAKATGKTKTGL